MQYVHAYETFLEVCMGVRACVRVGQHKSADISKTVSRVGTYLKFLGIFF